MLFHYPYVIPIEQRFFSPYIFEWAIYALYYYEQNCVWVLGKFCWNK